MSDPLHGHPPDVWERMLQLLAMGQSLVAVCKLPGMPGRWAVYERLTADPAFADSYARAREFQADSIAEDALEAAITATDAQTGRLAFDARRWFAGKVRPGRWGERVAIDATHKTDPNSMTDAELAAIAAGRSPIAAGSETGSD